MNGITRIGTDKKVLVLGAGFGGMYTLRYLLRYLKKKERPQISLVNDENYFLFSPVLHEAATGVVNPSHIAYPIRKLSDDKFKFVNAEVLKIDLDNKQIITNRDTMNYDYLVIALGSVTNTPQFQNEGQRVFTLKTLHDAILLRTHLVQVFEEASAQKDPEKIRQLLTFVISGGGYSGVQLTATLTDVLRKYFTKYYKSISSDDISIILIEAQEEIIHSLDSAYRKYIVNHLQSSGVQVMPNSRITRATRGTIEINGQDVISTSTLVWVTGVQANPRVAEMAVEKDEIGRVHVNDFLQIPDYPDVYVLGDCSYYWVPEITRSAAPRAHNAVRQAKAVAYNIAAELRGRAKKPYNYTDSAEVISLGRSRALLRFHKNWIYGLPAVFFFVISYSLLALGMKARLLVLLDWLLSRAFGPDISLLERVEYLTGEEGKGLSESGELPGKSD